jgi:allophycocyanin beta subunit
LQYGWKKGINNMAQDAITAVINSADVQGKYLDSAALEKLKGYFSTGDLRVRAAGTISANAAAIVKEAVAKSLLYSDVTRPGGNMYTTRRYAACIRDLDYYLRYATYAMLAGDPSILDERVLNGLKETYNSLGVPVSSTVQAIQAIKEVTASLVGADAGKEMGVYLDYISSGLS